MLVNLDFHSKAYSLIEYHWEVDVIDNSSC